MSRPRESGTEAALDSAMRLTWAKGPEATSVAGLTRTIGINPPSLYLAFGDKQLLFRAVLEPYAAGPNGGACVRRRAPDRTGAGSPHRHEGLAGDGATSIARPAPCRLAQWR